MHKVNAGYTLLLRVRDGNEEELRALLIALEADRTRMPFADSVTTHFATITIIPDQTHLTNSHEPLPATLLFATSFCGPLRDHVRELVDLLGTGVRAILAHCEGFDPTWSHEELQTFLREQQHGSTFYSAMPDLGPQDVRNHEQLRDAIDEFLDQRQAAGGFTGTPSAIQREIQAHVRSRPELAWAREPFAPPLRAWWLFHWRSLVVEGGVLALLAATIVNLGVDSTVLGWIVRLGWLAVAAFFAFIVVLVIAMREAEHEQTFVSQRQSDEFVRDLAATQHRAVINEFTLAGPIKEGILRPIFLRLSLWIIARVAEGVPGMPYVGTGIDIPTVATARWIPTDGGRRLMFISNYTNDAVPYVRDFIETRGGAMRINLSFGFGRGYPKTKWVLWEGALTNPNAYLYALCDHQRTTLFWYGPYTGMSIDNIKRNREVREGLFADYDDDQAKKWLALL